MLQKDAKYNMLVQNPLVDEVIFLTCKKQMETFNKHFKSQIEQYDLC